MYEISDISFSFDSHQVFQHASFALPEAGMVAVVGENGIGKTTLLRILGGYYKTNFYPQSEKRAMYLDAEFLTLDMLTVREFVELLAHQGGHLDGEAVRMNPLISEQMVDTRIAALSLGQRQRLVLSVATSLLAPAILLLDEPFNGLDEAALVQAREQLRLVAASRTVLFATHFSQDIDEFADYILRINGSSDISLSALSVSAERLRSGE